MNWSIKSSKRKQNRSKANNIPLNRSDEDNKVHSAAKKHSWKKMHRVNKTLLEN